MIDKVIVKDNFPLLHVQNPNVFQRPLNSIGKNWHINNKEPYLPGYHPQVAHGCYPDKHNPGCTYQEMELSFSLPKLLFGNNLYELRNADRNRVYKTLESKLQAMSIVCSPWGTVRDLNIYYIEYAKNIYTGNMPVAYVLDDLHRATPPSSTYMDVEKTSYRNGGELLGFYCKGYSVVFYDKGAEIAKNIRHNYGMIADQQVANLFIGKTPPNILRMEVRFHNRNTLKTFMTTHKLAKGVKFSELFSEQISRFVLQYYWEQLNKTGRRISPHVLSPAYELWKIHQHTPKGTRNNTQVELAELGVRYLVREHGYKGAISTLNRIGCSNPSSYIRSYINRVLRPARRLDVYAFITTSLTKFSCLSRKKWLHLKLRSSAPWYYTQEPLLQISEVATWLAITTRQVHHLIRTGKLVAKAVSRRILRIQRRAVLEYLSA